MPRWIPSGEPPPEKKVVSFVVSKSSHPDLVAWLHSLPYGGGSNLIRSILDQVAKTGKYSPDEPPPSFAPSRQVARLEPQATAPIQQPIPRQPHTAHEVFQNAVATSVAPPLQEERGPGQEDGPESVPLSVEIDSRAAQVLQDLADMC